MSKIGQKFSLFLITPPTKSSTEKFAKESGARKTFKLRRLKTLTMTVFKKKRKHVSIFLLILELKGQELAFLFMQ